MSPTVSQGLILPRCEFKQMCDMGLVCGFQSHYWRTDSSDGCKKQLFYMSFYMYCVCVCVWLRGRLKVITGGVMTSPHPSCASTSVKYEPSLSRKKEEMTQLKQEVLQGDQ